MSGAPANPLKPSLVALLRAGMAEHAAGRLAAAEAAYRRALTEVPDNPDALGLLGLVLAEGPDVAEAEAVLGRHLALRPRAVASLMALGRLKAARGDDRAAADLLQRAAAAQPDLAPAHNELGVARHRLGEADAALAALTRAAALDPAYGAAHGNRGVVLAGLGRDGEAAEALVRALDLGADEGPLVKPLARAARKAGRLAEAEAAVRRRIETQGPTAALSDALATILDDAGRRGEALAVRNDLARRAGVQRSGRRDAQALKVLVLGAVGAGHTPTRYLLDPAAFAILSFTLLSPEAADAPLGGLDAAELAAADVVFASLGDVDRDWGQLEAAAEVCRALRRPVLNPPAAIAKTGRHQAQALFAGIEGLTVPATWRTSPAELAAERIEAPLLVRPAGDHGGENLVRLRSAAERDAYLAAGAAERLVATRFADYRSADGRWRKYRFVFVDRRPYAFHLAVGDHWLLHYWRAEMARSDAARAEEARFLADWRGVFGPRAAGAVEEIGRRLDLDYAGLDCALTEAGEVVLFEANATVLLHLDDPQDLFAYKHAAVPPIRQAFTDLVRARAAGRG